MDTSVIVLLALAIVCWVVMLLTLSGVAGRKVTGDAAMGQGLGWMFTMVAGGLLWLWIGGLLLKAGTQDLLPGWNAAAAVAL